MSFNWKVVRISTIITLMIVFLIACGGINNRQDRSLSLTIAHINDTHSHLEPSDHEWETFVIDGVNTKVKVGGVTRLKTALDELRSSHSNVLLLHAGDAVQGTLYFNVFQGVADFDFLNYLGVEAMTFGNHEFDKGAAVAGKFVALASFPILSANIDVSREPSLAGKVAPFLIKRYGSDQVAIIGVTTTDTAVTSSPGNTVTFNNVTESVTRTVALLKSFGINKIIVLSHIGYDEDIKLAGSVAGIDVIVGGHSHTLLGDPVRFAPLGITPVNEILKGAYPTEMKGPENETVLIVQGWRWTEELATLDVNFDAAGRIVSYRGETCLLVQDIFVQNNIQLQPGSDAYLNVIQKINATAIARVYDENAEAAARLLPYSQQLETYKTTIIAQAAENLTRGPNSGPGPLFADAMIWKTGAGIAIENRGEIKTDLTAGNITVGDVLDVLPYGGTIVLMNLTGQQIKDALEDGCDYQISRGGDWFPYVSGMTYSIVNNPTVPKGQRITSLKVKNDDGSFSDINMAGTYRVVTNNFMAAGGDGFTTLKNQGSDTGLIDADIFSEYLQFLGTVNNPAEQRVTVLTMITGAIGRFAARLHRCMEMEPLFFKKAA